MYLDPRKMQSPPLWLWAIMGVAIVLFTNGISSLFGSGLDYMGNELSTSRNLQLLRVFFYTLGFGLIFLVPRKKTVLDAMGWWLVALLAWVMISVLWSGEKVTSLIRIYGVIGTTLLAVVMAVYFDWKQFLRLVTYSYVVIIIVTFAVCILMPHIGIHQGDSHDGAWKGAMLHKNVLGRMMVIGFALAYFARKSLEGGERKLALFVMVGALALVLLSTSVTSMATLLLMALLSLILPVLQRLPPLLIMGTGLLSIVAILVFMGLVYSGALNLDALLAEIFGTAGRDLTFTGRTTIWEVSLREWMAHNALLGFGYGGFWSTPRADLGVSWGMGLYIPPHAHNVFMQVGTELGFIGLILLLGFFITRFGMAWRFMRTSNLPIAALPVLAFILALILNIFETGLLQQRNAIWFFFVAIFVMMRLHLLTLRKTTN